MRLDNIQQDVTEKISAKDRINKYLNIVKWLPYSDREISMFQYFFLEYCEKNNNNFTKNDYYKIAILSTNVQYQMRILKSRINKEFITQEEIETNNNFISFICSLDGLVEFIIGKMNSYFENLPPDKKYEYIKDSFYSYYSSNDSILDSIKRDGERFIKNEFKNI